MEKLLADLEMLPDDLRALGGIRTTLDEIFLLVVVGEYNAGKSTLINCLLEDSVLEVGICRPRAKSTCSATATSGRRARSRPA